MNFRIMHKKISILAELTRSLELSIIAGHSKSERDALRNKIFKTYEDLGEQITKNHELLRV